MEAPQSSHKKKRDDSPPILKAEDALRQSSPEKKRDDSPPIHKTEDGLKMRLWRILDFLSLILSYPMKTWHERELQDWIEKATLAGKGENTNFPTSMNSPFNFEVNIDIMERKMEHILSTSPLDIMEHIHKRDIHKMEHILSTSPLKHLELPIPSDIIKEIEHGRRFLFKDHEGKSEQQQLTSSTSNTREGKQVLQLNEVDAVIPQSILNLAADLAVNQLMHYFYGYSYEWKPHKVRLSTRNVDEMLAVKGKIEGALKDVGRRGLFRTETKVIWIDASKYQVDKEATVTQEIAKELSTKTNLAQRHEFFTTERERMREFITMEENFHKNILVIVVDGNGENKLRLEHVHFPHPKMRYETSLVLLSTESSTDENDESRMELDLEIRTEDHLLPWLLFSRNVGSELLCSSSAIQNIAVQIVEECRGHLLAVVLVAKSLKNVTDVERWKLALEKLRCTKNPDSVDCKSVMDNAFRNIIWEDLNIIQKRCLRHFLFLSNDEGQVPVTFLMSKWVDRGLVYTPEEAEHILQQLLDCSILLKLEGTDVQLPMETHQILLSLTGFDQIQGMRGKKQLDYTDSELWEELPWEIEDLVALERLVIVRTPITNLPQFPEWPNLQELDLQHNAGLTKIPSSFFEKMCELRILNLSYTNISGLPSSFSYLERLKELFLRGCELVMELPQEIAQLKTLTILDLSYTNISELPSSFSSLERLQELYLRGCELFMELPQEIARLKTLTILDLSYTNISELPSSFSSLERLQELYLRGCELFMELPQEIARLKTLTILDLSYTNISELPSSFSSLERLQELYLRGCELFMELPLEITRLKTLEKLDLDNTQITHLPREIQELTNLQSLTLCFYGYDQSTGPIIPPGVISNLTNLSDLSIDVNPDDNRWDKDIQAILPEFSELRELKTLTLYIPRVKLLKHLLKKKCIDFSYIIGDHKERLISREPLVVTEIFKKSRCKLRFVNGKDVPKEINTILKRTEAFFLDRHMSIKSLSEFDVGYVRRLRTCIVGECNEMEMLVDRTSRNKNLLRHVEFLSVYYMRNLQSIWRGPAPSIPCFHRLKYIAFHPCPKLTTIFTLDFLDNLSVLEDLVVEDCSRVTTLISHESSNVPEKRFLPSLKRLLLVYLPELVSIFSGLLIGEGLEKIGFYYCPKLQRLSQQELSSQDLRIIKGETKWWEELNWNQWEQAEQPNKFNDIFSPVNEEDDIMSQLVVEIRSKFNYISLINNEADVISWNKDMISDDEADVISWHEDMTC